MSPRCVTLVRPQGPPPRDQRVAGLGNVCPEGALLFLPLCLPSFFDPLILGGGNHRGEGTHRAGGSLPGLQTAWTPGEKQDLRDKSPPPMPAPTSPRPCPSLQGR